MPLGPRTLGICAALVLTLLGSSTLRADTITEIIDASGDGVGHPLAGARDVAVDAAGNVFVIGNAGTHNVFKIAAPGSCSASGSPCAISEILDASGDGAGNGVSVPESLAVDASGNVYVAASGSSSVHRIQAPGSCSTSGTPCTITQIIDASGDGVGNPLTAARGLAVDASGNVYVGGRDSSNAFKIETPGSCSTNGTPCTITQIIWFHGAPGSGNRLDGTSDLTVDAAGNVYLSARNTDNAFKIEAPDGCSTGGTLCTITEIIDDLGDGVGNLLARPMHIAVDPDGHVYVTGSDSHNAFRIEAPGSCSATGTPCAITQIIDASGDGAGNPLSGSMGIATDASGNVYLAGESSHNAFAIDTPGACSTTGSPCSIGQIIDAAGDGAGSALNTPSGVALDAADTLFIAAAGSDNVFRIGPAAPQVPTLGLPSRALLLALLLAAALPFARPRPASA